MLKDIYISTFGCRGKSLDLLRQSMQNLEIAPQELPPVSAISEERKRQRQQEQERRRKETVCTIF